MKTILPVAAAIALSLAACGHSEGGSTAGSPPAGLPSSDAIAAVPMGPLAGGASRAALAHSIDNPFAGDPQAVAEGSRLYIKLNCAGCHAYTGKGNMGPDLTDTYWRYGGLPVDVYKSIADGRAKGMPAWGAALPPADIWKLVAYIQSFGGTVAVGNGPGHPEERGQVAPEALARAATTAMPPLLARAPAPASSASVPPPAQRTSLPLSASSQ